MSEDISEDGLLATPVILDTDIGGDPDDTIALMLAARLLPELALVLTSDEVGGQRARFARYLLDLAGRPEVPVVSGRELRADAVFCADGLTPPIVEAVATDVIAAVAGVCETAGATVRWIGMGPLSNMADVVSVRPELASVLAVTQMGGALRYRDPSRAEHNFRQDPAAVHIALAAIREPTLVTSEITFVDDIEVTTDSAVYRALTHDQAPRWAGVVTAHLDRWFDRYHPGSMQHDALTLSTAMRLPFVDVARLPVLLHDDARMSTGGGGIPMFVSVRADYGAFNTWLLSSLAPWAIG
jgi:pyrimidine-specific ribonucleoside hydrolase